jgi:hypothetical protein
MSQFTSAYIHRGKSTTPPASPRSSEVPSKLPRPSTPTSVQAEPEAGGVKSAGELPQEEPVATAEPAAPATPGLITSASAPQSPATPPIAAAVHVEALPVAGGADAPTGTDVPVEAGRTQTGAAMAKDMQQQVWSSPMHIEA